MDGEEISSAVEILENPLALADEESGQDPTSILNSPATAVPPSVAARFTVIEQQLSALSADAKVDEGDKAITPHAILCEGSHSL
jgi:hypothetical protein